MSDDTPYWLCCGSTDYRKHKSGCNEREMGNTYRCKFRTAEEHRENMIVDDAKLMPDYIAFWNDQKNWKYTIEPHGDGYALYWGRTPFHHGYNLAHLTEIGQRTIDMIYTALNKELK